MTPAWLEGMRRYCERRLDGMDVSAHDYAQCHWVMVQTVDGRRHCVAVMADDWPKDVADALEDGMRAVREARRMR